MNLNTRLLSSVKRWSVVHTIRQQSVGEHLALGLLLCEDLFNKIPIASGSREDVLRGFLTHDLFEVITNDAPSSVNTLIKNIAGDAWREKIGVLAQKVGVTKFIPTDGVRVIVRYVDLLESVQFLMQEKLMGNQLVGEVQRHLVGLTNAALQSVGDANPHCSAALWAWHDDQIDSSKFSVVFDATNGIVDTTEYPDSNYW